MGQYWFNQGMAFLPIFFVIWTYLTFSISYIISVKRNDTDAAFPYISDTGARRPESSVFGMMLNISAFAAFACMYVRYKQVNEYVEVIANSKYKLVKGLNKFSLYVGFLVCLGMSLVANFQETSVLTVHVIGALMTFALGTVYEFIHSFITLKMHPEVNGKLIFFARLIISILSLLTLVGGFVASSYLTGMKLHWNPDEPGYAAHLASTILEWCLAGSFLSYFFTLIRDFQKITLSAESHLHQINLHHDVNHRYEEMTRDADVNVADNDVAFFA